MYFGPVYKLYLSQIKNTLTDSGTLHFTATGMFTLHVSSIYFIWLWRNKSSYVFSPAHEVVSWILYSQKYFTRHSVQTFASYLIYKGQLCDNLTYACHLFSAKFRKSCLYTLLCNTHEWQVFNLFKWSKLHVTLWNKSSLKTKWPKNC
jgi:hypothetical protein